MKQFTRVVILIIFALNITILQAQTDVTTEEEFIANALASATATCENMTRNQVCYGYADVNIESDTSNFTFENPGDSIDLVNLGTLDLSPFNSTDNTFGVAVFRIQADIEDDVDDDVSLIAFGDVQITNDVEVLTELTVQATGNVNVRSRPNSNANNIMTSLAQGAEVRATGRLADTSWIRIVVENDARGVGWVSASFLTSDSDLSDLDIVEPDSINLNPMQAFTFTSTETENDVLDSGILIQTPSNTGSVTLIINGLTTTLRSTAFIQTVNQSLIINMLSGSATINAEGVTQIVPAGTLAEIALDETGQVINAPSAPQPYNFASLTTLPVEVALPDEIEVASAVQEENIAEAVQQAETAALASDIGIRSGNWQIGYGPQNANAAGGHIITITGADSFSLDGNILSRIDGMTFQWEIDGGQARGVLTLTFTSETTFTGTMYVDDYTNNDTRTIQWTGIWLNP